MENDFFNTKFERLSSNHQLILVIFAVFFWGIFFGCIWTPKIQKVIVASEVNRTVNPQTEQLQATFWEGFCLIQNLDLGIFVDQKSACQNPWETWALKTTDWLF